MVIHGAVVKEQGQTFAVVVVQPAILASQVEAQKTVTSLKPIFPNMPIVLMAQEEGKKARFVGRADIAQFLAGVPVNSIPWKRYDVQVN
jgi:hypothetical protein